MLAILGKSETPETLVMQGFSISGLPRFAKICTHERLRANFGPLSHRSKSGLKTCNFTPKHPSAKILPRFTFPLFAVFHQSVKGLSSLVKLDLTCDDVTSTVSTIRSYQLQLSMRHKTVKLYPSGLTFIPGSVS